MTARFGNGKRTHFWLQNWTGSGILKDQFPILFNLEANKLVYVADRLTEVGNVLELSWDWKQPLRSQRVRDELGLITPLILSTVRSDREDVWVWSPDKEGLFSVKSVRKLFEPQPMTAPAKVFPWSKLLPIKVNVFGWRIWLGRLPTKVALLHRNVHLESSYCSFCEEAAECVDHLFSGCRYTHMLWEEIKIWCRLTSIIAFSANDLIFLHESLTGSNLRRTMTHLVIMVSCWVIWKARNRLIFDQKKTTISEMVGEIKSVGLMWAKHRAISENISDCQWFEFNFL